MEDDARMQGADAGGGQALSWLRPEVERSLEAARQRLNAFAEDPARRELLNDFARRIHEAGGAFALLGLAGPRLLGEHIEALAQAVETGKRPAESRYLEPLMRACLELSDHFERLAAGVPEVPAQLLPSTNELRALLDQAPLARERLGPPAPAAAARGQIDLAALAGRLRPEFQAALLSFYRGRDAHAALDRMQRVVVELERAATDPAVFEFFWVVGGLVEALAHEGLRPSLGTKRLLGQIEREIKRLARGSETEMAQRPPQVLLDELIGQIGRSHSQGERVAAIRGSFRREDEGAETRGGSALLRSVGGAILEDLGRVRDRIDIFMRTGRKDPATLAPLGTTLKKVADALGMLGLGEAQARVEREREAVLALAGGGLQDDQGMLRLATELIGIESEVESFLVGSGGDPASAAARAAYAAGLREVLAEIARIKDTITEHLRGAGAGVAFTGLPAVADRLAATLDFLELEQPAALMRRIACYFERMAQSPEEIVRSKLDRLADAVVSVEYYVETLQIGREPRISMLENADRALAALGVREIEGTVEARRQRIAEAEAAETVGAGAEVERAATPAAPPRPLEPVREAGADPAIVTVFLEEAGEVVQTLNAAYPRWRAEPADRDALVTVRRSFHTLKGSGRMVGARLLGEFAWTVENLLNRVLDRAIAAEPALVELVGEAVDAVPQLVTQFSDGSEPAYDVAQLMARAGTLARGEAAEAQPAAQAAPNADTAPEAEAADEPVIEVPGIDEPETEERPLEASEAERTEAEAPAQETPEREEAAGAEPAPAQPRLPEPLYAIYRSETLDHLGVLRRWNEAVAQEEESEITPELVRAVHTLKGSARMAGVEETSAIMEPLEEGLERAVAAGEGARRVADDVAAAASAAAVLLDAYGDAATALPEWRSVYERLCALRDSLPETAGLETEALEAGDDDVAAAGGREAASAESPPAPARIEAEAPRAHAEAEEGEVLDLPSLPSYDADLAQLFGGEAFELLEGAEASLRTWRANHGSVEALSDLLRGLHTLKGGARMAGIAPFADLVHELESLLTLVSQGRLAVTPARLGEVERALDGLQRMLEHVSGDGRVPLERELVAEIRRETATAGGYEEHAAGGQEQAEEQPALAQTEAPDTRSPAPVAPEFAVTGSARATESAARARILQRRRGLTRVRADLLETSINSAGEVGIFRARIEQQLVDMRVHLAELERTVERVRSQLRELEIETEAQILSSHEQRDVERLADFDPLEFDRYTHIQELSRSLAEAVSDLVSLRTLFGAELRQAEEALERQGRVNVDLQNALLRTRMMPFSLSEGRLRRIVRQVAEESGKQIDFRLTGTEGEMDRQVLDHVLPALEHLLRNAVVHGIELPEERRRRGKPEIGRIELVLRHEGADTVIEVADDGRGLDLAAIRARAESEGLIAEGAELAERELVDFVFRPGFSTAGELSQAAGRGVGMDVVAAEVRHVGGGVEVVTRADEGTRVTLRFPAMLAITNSLIVRAGGKRHPLPLASIGGVARVSRDALDALLAEDTPAYEYGGAAYELVSLARALGEEPQPLPEEVTRVPLLMAQAGERRIAFIADEMEGNREIVVKPIGPQIGRIPGIAGATIFGDGSIGLLIDLTALVRAMPALEAGAEGRRRTAALAAGAAPLVLVVDDSITVRRVTERMLARHGVRVITAKDGIEALEQLEDHTPDLVLLDIEMPRMDGYELAERIRGDQRLHRVPIIVITSRAGEKHRARAVEIGIERYLGKPYQESELLAAIRAVVGGLGALSERAVSE